MAIKKTSIKKVEAIPAKSLDIAKSDQRNRKRGKGKIKIVKRQHVNSEELKNELIKFKKCGIASERLGEIFLDLVENLATKSNFSGYSYLEEMKSKAIFFLLNYSKNYNPGWRKAAMAQLIDCNMLGQKPSYRHIPVEKIDLSGRAQYD